MESINLNGVTFRWHDGQLLITTSHGQSVLAASQVAQLLDFLQFHQQSIYAGEQGLPSWAIGDTRYVAGTVEHQAMRLKEGK
jgi:hypothetical protein